MTKNNSSKSMVISGIIISLLSIVLLGITITNQFG